MPAKALVPAGVVTVTSTVPVPAGEVAVIWVSEPTVKEVAGLGPKRTALAPVKPVPVMVTDVPPAAGPEVGLMAVTDGPPVYVNRSPGLVALVPPGPVTVTCTTPVPAGEVAVICVSETTAKLEAAVEPNLTPVAPVKPVPVTVTVVPPVADPEVGLMAVTEGASV